MNFKMLIFSGIMTALVGVVLSLVINHISQWESRKPLAIIFGSTLGFVIGVSYEAVQQSKHNETNF